MCLMYGHKWNMNARKMQCPYKNNGTLRRSYGSNAMSFFLKSLNDLKWFYFLLAH